MTRANLTASAWDATLPLVRSDSFAAPLTSTNFWGIWTPSTGCERVLFTGTEEQVKGTLSEGGRIVKRDDRWVIEEPF